MDDEDDWFKSPHSPRPHHYFFAHKLLREFVAHDPRSFIRIMGPDELRAQAIEKLWAVCDERLLQQFGRRTFDVGTTKVRLVRFGAFGVFCIWMPPAERMTEVILAMVVPLVPAEEWGRLPERLGFRFFTAELAIGGIAVCEWADEAHVNFGVVETIPEALDLVSGKLGVAMDWSDDRATS